MIEVSNAIWDRVVRDLNRHVLITVEYEVKSKIWLNVQNPVK